MKSNRPLNLLFLFSFLLLLTPGSSAATVAMNEPSQIDALSGALLLSLAVGDIVVVGQNLSPEVPPSTPRHVFGLGLGIVSLGVASQLNDTGLALAFAVGGSLTMASSVGRLVQGHGILSKLSFDVANRGLALRTSF